MRRVNAERAVLFGWSRAILLQIAHPLIAAGVYDHSGFRASPIAAIARLHHTVAAMLALTFGDPAERQRTIDGIRAIHRRVQGSLPVDAGTFRAGAPYSAEDPELVLWVHVTLLESVPLIYEMLVGPLTDDERNQYCAEAAQVAIDLGARDSRVPRTWAAARAHAETMYASGILAVTPQAREVARALLAPRFASFVAPAAWVNRLLTVGLLPPSVRAQYGFAWGVGYQRAWQTTVHTLRFARRCAPQMVARWPQARG